MPSKRKCNMFEEAILAMISERDLHQWETAQASRKCAGRLTSDGFWIILAGFRDRPFSQYRHLKNSSKHTFSEVLWSTNRNCQVFESILNPEQNKFWRLWNQDLSRVEQMWYGETMMMIMAVYQIIFTIAMYCGEFLHKVHSSLYIRVNSVTFSCEVMTARSGLQKVSLVISSNQMASQKVRKNLHFRTLRYCQLWMRLSERYINVLSDEQLWWNRPICKFQSRSLQ